MLIDPTTGCTLMKNVLLLGPLAMMVPSFTKLPAMFSTVASAVLWPSTTFVMTVVLSSVGVKTFSMPPSVKLSAAMVPPVPPTSIVLPASSPDPISTVPLVTIAVSPSCGMPEPPPPTRDQLVLALPMLFPPIQVQVDPAIVSNPLYMPLL